MMARGLLVGAVALVLAGQVVRNASVATLAPLQPDTAARLWAGHPDVIQTRGLTEIARLARTGQPVGAAILQPIYASARKAPLAPEPFLVRGVQAQTAGDTGTAVRAFLAAQWRDPRSLPAAYFLADHYVRAGDAGHGLREIAVLSRLAPNGPGTVAPYVAAYAQNRANWPALRQLFGQYDELQDAALFELAHDARRADTVLALATPSQTRPDSRWLPVLIDALITAGQYDRARAVWASVSRAAAPRGALLYDSGFRDSSAPPPFNWSLSSSTAGVAERQAGGRLHLLYYGDEDGVLARQLLLLPEGSYALTMQLLGDAARAAAISWRLRCDKATEPFASVTLDKAARGWAFRVPAGCRAQWLELAGRSADMPQQADVTIAALTLHKVQAR